ncbi:MAG: Co2+/Mg2+ efflux protein ApaG [Pseudomonadota bacterium]
MNDKRIEDTPMTLLDDALSGESMLEFAQETNEISITVRPEFLAHASNEAEGQFAWAYHILIENCSQDSVRLRARYWRITDAQGRVQEVKGPGVLGLQPVIAPGEVFSYSSSVPLDAPSGLMHGHYLMERDDGGSFVAEIPAFSLDSPTQAHRAN